MPNALVIHSIDLFQFKHHTTPVHYDCYADTLITGTNGVGKTSLADAVLFTLFGVNAQGSKQLDSWLPKHAPQSEAMIYTAVTIEALDGLTHTIQRQRTASSTKLLLDGKQVKQDQLTPLVGTVTHFLPAWLPHTFGLWKDTEAREFWTRLLPKIDPAHILLVMGDAAQPLADWPVERFAQLDVIADQLRSALLAHETDVDRLTGSIATLHKSLEVPVVPPAPEPNTVALQQAREALAQLTAPNPPAPDWSAYYHTIAQLDAALQDQTQRHPEHWVDPHPAEQALAAWEVRYAQHAAAAPREDLDRVNVLRAEYQTLYAQWSQLPPPTPNLPPTFAQDLAAAEAAVHTADTAVAVQAAHPVTPPNAADLPTTCPVCHQPLPADQQAEWQAQATAAYTAWRSALDRAEQHQREAQQRLERLVAQRTEATTAAEAQWAAQKQALQERLHHLKTQGQAVATEVHTTYLAAQAAFDQEHHALLSEGETLRTTLAQIQATNAALPPLPSVETLMTQRAEAQAALEAAKATWAAKQAQALTDYQAQRTTAQATVQAAEAQWEAQHTAWVQYTADRDQRARLTQDLQTQTTLLQETHQTIATLKAELVAIRRYTVTRSELEMQPLQSSLNHTRVELWEPTKTTDTDRPIFRLTWKGVPFIALSHSERIACTAELTFSLATLTGIVRPTFLDNAESCAVSPMVPGQRFVAQFRVDVPTVHVQAALPQPVADHPRVPATLDVPEPSLDPFNASPEAEASA